MTELKQVYRCEVCGNIVEILHPGAGELVCCQKPMKLLKTKTKDEGQEKHVPVVEKNENGIKVKVGSIPHPMVQDHFIEWIEVMADGKVYRQHLKPGEAPEAQFCVQANQITVRQYCNLHGLWQA